MIKNNDRSRYLIPIIIIAIGIIISGVIIINRTQRSYVEPDNNFTAVDQEEIKFISSDPENVKPLNSEDHILGNPNAPVKIIEFSDLECPSCKIFHLVMNSIMNTYGKNGQVVWVYRHFPLDSIHSKARKEAVASECAGEIGGNETFWNYIGRLFEITPSNNNLDLTLLPEIAEYVGINVEEFNKCLESERYDEHVENNFRDAIDSGASGTPYTIIVAPDGKMFPMTGAQTYQTVSSIINIALKGQ